MRDDFFVDAVHAGLRLDMLLKKRLPEKSRVFLQSRVRSGEVLVGGRKVKPDYRVRVSDRITLEFSETESKLVPQPALAIPVLYEDASLVVIDKPAGISVHPSAINGTNTVANWFLGRYPAVRGVGDSVLRPGIMHRLDRGTSGVMALAKTEVAFTHLKNLFKNHRVEKTYLALVEGVPKNPRGVIEGYLAPSARSFRRKALSRLPLAKSSKTSRTRYALKKSFGLASVVEFFPETGRTHQIRAHAAFIGHPVLGDRLYGAKLHFPREHSWRFFLHASRLAFRAPDGQKKEFSAPMPDDFEKIMHWLSGEELDKNRLAR